MLNRICAHPEIISCALGACALNAIFFGSLGGLWPAIVTDWDIMISLVVVFIVASLLGFMLGMFVFWPTLRVLCSKANGAPLKIGDQVMILSGPDKGRIAEVYDITLGQGGWELARLDLGTEAKEHFRDLFEEYSVLRTHRSEQGPALDWGQIAEYTGIKSRILLIMCAHPGAAAFLSMLAASALSALLILWLIHLAPSRNIAPYILGCGYIVVMTFAVVRVMCGRIKGDPLKPGDQVIVISGAFRGTIAEVCEIVLQNDGPVAILDLGLERKHGFDQRSLFKIRKSE